MSIYQHLDKINSFKIVVDAGKLSEASKRLNLSQPSLTRLIHTLESATGAKLLYRSRQGVNPTPAGILLYEFAKSTLKNLEDVEAQLKAPSTKLAGLLRVGSYESLAEYLWPNFMAKFKKAAPELKLSIRTNHPLAHIRDLENGDLDLLVDAEPRILGDFSSWTLYHDRFNFYAMKTHLPKLLSPGNIEELSLIYCPQAHDHENKSIITHLEKKGYFFKEKVELDSFTSVRTFCKSGIGLAVLPQHLADGIKEIQLVHLEGFPLSGFGAHSIYATIHNRRKDDPRIKHLVKALKAWYKT